MAAVEYADDQPAGFTNRIEKVAIVGATGYLGQHFTRALLATGRHRVTAVTRAAGGRATATALPDGVARAEVDYAQHASLVAALRGHDFLVVTLSIHAPPDTTARLAAAAADAGVRWVMPNAYGPNPANAAMYDDMGFTPAYRAVLAALHDRALRPVVLSCGFWYEFSLAGGLMRYGFDVPARRFTVFDGGDVPICTSTLPQCGRALAALLSLPVLPSRPDASSPAPSSASSPTTLASFVEPALVHVASFRVSQNDMFASLLRVTATTPADWTITHEPVADRWANAARVLASGAPGVELDGVTPLPLQHAFGMRMYSRVFFPGGDAVAPADLDNDRLGLPREDLDEWTREAVRMAESGEVMRYGQASN